MKTIAQKLLDLGFKRPLSDETTHAAIDELAVARRTIQRLEEDNAALLNEKDGALQDRDRAEQQRDDAQTEVFRLKREAGES